MGKWEKIWENGKRYNWLMPIIFIRYGKMGKDIIG